MVGRINLSAIVSVAPGAGPGEVEIHFLLESRYTIALGVYGLDIKERDVGSIGDDAPGTDQRLMSLLFSAADANSNSAAFWGAGRSFCSAFFLTGLLLNVQVSFSEHL